MAQQFLGWVAPKEREKLSSHETSPYRRTTKVRFTTKNMNDGVSFFGGEKEER